METRNCKNCKQDFIIEPDDFSFYDKMKVPAPTWCPECRFARRLLWRNERSLYKRTCSMCEKNIIAMYDEGTPFPVYCIECYRSDNWGSEIYAQEYDFNTPFFSQWKDLFNRVPRQSIRHIGECVDSLYANFVDNSKNVYLSYSALWGSENIFYSNNVDKSKDIFDSFNSTESELVYQSINVLKNYNCQYSYWSLNCINCNFILDCNNCQDCFGCVNLQNKRYCIFNEQYTKEGYEEKIKSMDMGSHSFVENFKHVFWDFSLRFPRKYSRSINCINSSGDVIRDSNNSHHIFNSYGCENVKYGYRVVKSNDSMDVCFMVADYVYEHGYGGSENSQNLKFIIEGQPSCEMLEYSDTCKSSSNLFGCIGLKNSQYSILNKQYSKEAYFEMVEKIKKHMDDMPYVDSKGRVYKYGEFFPCELCPFGYNESLMNDISPLTKEEIVDRGYKYKKKIDKKYIVTLKAEDISDNIKAIDDNVLNEVIGCEVSGRAFKLTPFEFQFYKKMNIPIPRLHPDERYKERIALRNPMILYHRICMKEGCKNEFETTYAPNRPEIVYCESCYHKEVY